MLALREHDPERIADYRLLGRLGEGGMGVVYLARSSRGRMVAVKSIRAELATVPDFRTRFANEITVAQQVGGDWTAAVLDADPHAERPWVATAYIPGPTLTDVVNRHGPLPEQSVRGLASGLCAALADIHAAGLVHRDLKPSNVMITIDGPKVIDFGIVRALDDPTRGGLTSTGLIVGTAGFMAPEQIRGERLTEASDIFSLGAVLTFAASGQMAFETPGGQAHAIMYRVVHEEPDLTGVPNPLLPLIRDCLAKGPAARPTLDALRAREETQYPVLGPWLPAAVLARLGQDAAQLLEREDPHTRATPDAALVSTPPMPHATVTEPARPVTAPITAPNTPQRPAHLSHEDEQPRRTLAEERNWHNLGEAAEKCVYRHRGCLRPAPAPPDEPPKETDPTTSSPWPTGHRFAERTRAKHATIHALLDAGHSKRSVARQLGMTLNTVMRFSRATTPEEMFTGQWQSRATPLDAYKPYLDQRWQEGCTNAWKLWEELCEQGYRLPQWIESARATT
ncbi:protein kinase domain-containing protein [Streptomyces sp. WAC 04229]|uniref:protein kinase domain-containing protein n=1 Tax=Streptomyces sp. WAC 04229 TaxID=2203206 RepID=UPI0026B22F0B|nr:protein kinase [Streptomyces sp. WAC 04229]